MKENLRNKTGITLVALVVTIIVLLILAGVTIALLLGDNGIITKAQHAKDETERTATKEQEWLDSLSSEIDRYVTGEVPAPEGSLLAMYRQAIADNCDNADGSCTNPNHLHIGDYVNYVEPTSGSYTVSPANSGMTTANGVTEMNQTYTLSETQNNVNWRVLGIDEATGGVKLIAADPIERDAVEGVDDPYLYLYGAESYVYGPTELDNICDMYLNTTYATKARSVNMDDINEITGITTVAEKQASNILYADGYSQIGASYSFENSYTPERWLEKKAKEAEGNGETVEGTTISGETKGYAYTVAKTQEVADSFAEEGINAPLVSNTRVYDMLFASYYWLASRGYAETDFDCVVFGPGLVYSEADITVVYSCLVLFFSNGNAGGPSTLPARPVVILKSDVLESAVPKIVDQASTWTYTPGTGE